MRLPKSSACALALASAAVGVAIGPSGCGNSLTSIYVSADKFPSAYAEALCNSLQHCCSENAVTFDYNACTAGWRALVQQRFTDPNAAALSNYDPKAATDCVAEVRDAKTVSCAPEPSSISAARDRCQQIFTGKKPPGSACITSSECAPVDGQVVVCAPLPAGVDGGGQLPLTHILSEPVCVATIAPVQGTPCSVTPPHGCEGGDHLYCDPGSLLCLPQSDIAQPCSAQVPGSCLPGGYCIQGGPNGGLCAAVLPQGSACTDSSQCDSSTTCDTQGTKTCVAKKAVGDACTDGVECANGACDAIAKKCLKNVIATTNACTGVGQ